MTGASAGEKKPDGTYPEGTVNYLAAKRLKELARTLKDFGKAKAAEKKKEENKS